LIRIAAIRPTDGGQQLTLQFDGLIVAQIVVIGDRAKPDAL
jgi:hypothetical protein